MTGFGIKKQLLKELPENLFIYLAIIEEIEAALGEGVFYSALKKLIVEKLADSK